MNIDLKIQTLIVDDEPLARQLVRSLLAKDGDIEVAAQCANGQEALEAIDTYRPELMFLDVQMPGLSGFDLLEKVPPGHMPYIIFITAYDQYAVKAFEIHALDYLLKPFEKERFYESLARAKAVIGQQALSNLTDKIFQLTTTYKGEKENKAAYLEELVIRDGGRILAVKTQDITWLEAANQYVRVHTGGASHLLSRSLDTLQKQLNAECFFRVHRSAVVNAHFVKEVRTAKNGACDIILTTGKSLKLSRGRKHILPELLKQCP
jgi:two-component system LytT family response regulator